MPTPHAGVLYVAGREGSGSTVGWTVSTADGIHAVAEDIQADIRVAGRMKAGNVDGVAEDLAVAGVGDTREARIYLGRMSCVGVAGIARIAAAVAAAEVAVRDAVEVLAGRVRDRQPWRPWHERRNPVNDYSSG